jgi:aminoglycoside phosphotransferase
MTDEIFDDAYCLILEKIEGVSLDHTYRDPINSPIPLSLKRKITHLFRRIHNTPIPEGLQIDPLINYRSRVMQKFELVEQSGSSRFTELKSWIKAYPKVEPISPTLNHGDYQIANLIHDPSIDRLSVVDWGFVSRVGIRDLREDLAWMYAVNVTILNKSDCDDLLNMYMKLYQEDTDSALENMDYFLVLMSTILLPIGSGVNMPPPDGLVNEEKMKKMRTFGEKYQSLFLPMIESMTGVRVEPVSI